MLIPWWFEDINIVLAVDKQAAEGTRPQHLFLLSLLHILFFSSSLKTVIPWVLIMRILL